VVQGIDNLLCKGRTWDSILTSSSEQMHAQCVQEIGTQARSALTIAAIQAVVVDHHWQRQEGLGHYKCICQA